MVALELLTTDPDPGSTDSETIKDKRVKLMEVQEAKKVAEHNRDEKRCLQRQRCGALNSLVPGGECVCLLSGYSRFGCSFRGKDAYSVLLSELARSALLLPPGRNRFFLSPAKTTELNEEKKFSALTVT